MSLYELIHRECTLRPLLYLGYSRKSITGKGVPRTYRFLEFLICKPELNWEVRETLIEVSP